MFLFSPSKLKLYRFSHSYSSPAGSPLPAASLLTNPDPPSWRVSCRSMHFVFLGWLSQRVVKKGWEGSLGDRRSTCEVVWRLIFNNKGNSLQLKSLLGNERCIIISYIGNLLTIDQNFNSSQTALNKNHYFIITSFSTTILAATLSA